MKKTILLSIFMAFAAMSITSAQDADKILEKHFKAIGQDKLNQIKTIDAKGAATMMGGMTADFHMTTKRPEKLRVVIEVQGMEIVQAYDGETAWMINPMAGASTPTAITGAEAAGISESGDMDGQLWQYKKKGHTLSYKGEETLSGKGVYVLKLTKKSGTIDTYYIDKESYMILLMKTTAPVNGTPMEVESYFSNYKSVEGYMMAMTTEQKIGGQTMMSFTFDDVKVNTDLSDDLFSYKGGK